MSPGCGPAPPSPPVRGFKGTLRVPAGRGGETPLREKLGVSGLTMCTPIKFSKLIRLVNVINSDKADKHDKLIEILNPICHEKLENKFRIKVINGILAKQRLRRPFTMYIDLHFDPEKNLVLLDYPFYPKSSK